MESLQFIYNLLIPCMKNKCFIFRGKSQADLRRHMDTHNKNEYHCHMSDCPFNCRTYGALSKHFKEQHQVRNNVVLSHNL